MLGGLTNLLINYCICLYICTAYRYYIFWCNCNYVNVFSQIKYI